MADSLEAVHSDSSENEDINQLFLRCKPKTPSDINLNKTSEDLQLENNGSDKLEQNVIFETNYIINSIKEESCEEDRSVVSAYGMYGINCVEDGKESKIQPNETNLFQEFKLRESRIEIAGGCEVYSVKRSRHLRKHVNGNADIMPKANPNIECEKYSSQQTEKESCADIAETLIGKSAVIYDDIGDSNNLTEVMSSEEEDLPFTLIGLNENENESLMSLTGNLQIAEYEGSPRRYGPTRIYPDRIICGSANETLQTILEPEIWQKCNSLYVGRRLAHFQVCIEESPRKNIYNDYLDDSMNKTQLFGNTLLSALAEDRISNSDTEDLAETEMGEQVGQSRNFTLSPETTDCDSNDLESEISYENEEFTLSDPLCSSMPVLEDGLSSGQVSDLEEPDDRMVVDNPTALLIKKQLTQIEKEISRQVMRKDCITNDAKQLVYETANEINLDFLDPICQHAICNQESVDNVIKEIKQAILKTKTLKHACADVEVENEKPVWLPRSLYNQKEDGNENLKIHKNEDCQEEECDTDQETDRLLGKQRMDDKEYYEEKGWCKESTLVMTNCTAESQEIESLNDSDIDNNKNRKEKDHRKRGRSKEVLIHEPAVLIEGVLFRARYLGSTQLVCEGQPTKATRMMQAEEAVSRIKAPEGENQPSTEVDLFISTEKIMVLNTDLKEIMMDHSLRTISYIADIGDLVVLMARRRILNCQDEQEQSIRRTPKMICHVFESGEAQFIAQSIGQAFQVAYMEFLKANGIEDQSFVKEMDYQEVLNSQEIYGDELEMFAKKEMQKEVIVPKARGEMLGVVIVESGWGSMLPTVVIANLSPNCAAARCGQLNIGDQIIAINGISLVGLPLSTCQNYIKNAKAQMVVKLTVVPCAPVVEVKIKRPDTKYQLGFSVQNGVICSLLRGGIAERGGVRVGHRIIEINGQSVVAVPHERIVNLLATSVGEILMKTMPTSMFRLLTGQETPIYI